MTPEIFSEWLRRQGQAVVRTAGSCWHSEGYGVYQAFPYHWLIQPSREELRELTGGHHAVALRYSAPFGAGPEHSPQTDAYHVVYSGRDYDLETLGSWARKNVRRGLRSCEVRPISFERYIEEGWVLRLDTLARQERQLKESKKDWRRKYEAAADLAGFDVWAAEVGSRLGATLVTFQMDGWGYMIYQQCHSDFLREHVNNALSFTVTQTLLRRPNIHGIYYGMRSLDAPPSVDEFKFRMGYEARPVRQRVVFHPRLAPLVNPLTHRLAQALSAARPHSRLLAKAVGMFRLGLNDNPDTAPASAAAQSSPGVETGKVETQKAEAEAEEVKA